MTSDETLTGALPTGWDHEADENWVDSLKDDGPATTSELVLVPGYTQSAWDRRQVRQLRLAEDAEAYLWANLDKPDDLLVYHLLLMLGYPAAAAAHMSPGGAGTVTAADEGTVYAAMLTPAPEPPPAAKPKPKPRRRPSQARAKAVRGAPPDAA